MGPFAQQMSHRGPREIMSSVKEAIQSKDVLNIALAHLRASK